MKKKLTSREIVVNFGQTYIFTCQSSLNLDYNEYAIRIYVYNFFFEIGAMMYGKGKKKKIPKRIIEC